MSLYYGKKLIADVSGGGSGLPDVEGSGKTLVSVNGEWKEQDGYGYNKDEIKYLIKDKVICCSSADNTYTHNYRFEIQDVQKRLEQVQCYTVVFDGVAYKTSTAVPVPIYSEEGTIIMGDFESDWDDDARFSYKNLPFIIFTMDGDIPYTVLTRTDGKHSIKIFETYTGDIILDEQEFDTHEFTTSFEFWGCEEIPTSISEDTTYTVKVNGSVLNTNLACVHPSSYEEYYIIGDEDLIDSSVCITFYEDEWKCQLRNSNYAKISLIDESNGQVIWSSELFNDIYASPYTKLSSNLYNLQVGKSYTIISDETEYSCVCVECNDIEDWTYKFLGNVQQGVCNFEKTPFVIMQTNLGVFIQYKDDNYHTISIIESPSAEKIDRKYLPEGLGYDFEQKHFIKTETTEDFQIQWGWYESSPEYISNYINTWDLFEDGRTYTIILNNDQYEVQCSKFIDNTWRYVSFQTPSSSDMYMGYVNRPNYISTFTLCNRSETLQIYTYPNHLTIKDDNAIIAEETFGNSLPTLPYNIYYTMVEIPSICTVNFDGIDYTIDMSQEYKFTYDTGSTKREIIGQGGGAIATQRYPSFDINVVDLNFDNNVPFFLIHDKMEQASNKYFLFVKEPGEHTFYIYDTSTKSQKIDKKYLPDGIGYEEDVILFDGLINIIDDYSDYYGNFGGDIYFKLNTTYEVTFDSITYTLNSSTNSGGNIYLGDWRDEYPEFKDVPFVILSADCYPNIYFAHNPKNTRLCIVEKHKHKIPSEYLPLGVGEYISKDLIPQTITWDGQINQCEEIISGLNEQYYALVNSDVIKNLNQIYSYTFSDSTVLWSNNSEPTSVIPNHGYQNRIIGGNHDNPDYFICFGPASPSLMTEYSAVWKATKPGIYFRYNYSDGSYVKQVTFPRMLDDDYDKPVKVKKIDNVFIDKENLTVNASNALTILTEAPTSDNLSGNYKIVHLASEPAQKYKGYIYCISEEE